MRGKHHLCCPLFYPSRIIPAHAGQTCNHGQLAEPVPDHPRACGANFQALPGKIGGFGSSPRMRGKLFVVNAQRSRSRIIPAHAGQTHAGHAAFMFDADHPRACGANHMSFGRSVIQVGSSPRMRGKRYGEANGTVTMRIIPAHAGQTSTRGVPSTSTSDHPRACGANTG